jgi:site-specific recombinase XerD
MKTNHKYLAWLQDKNLSQNTITSYLNALQGLPSKLTTQSLKEYFKAKLKRYEATTLKVRKYALNSYVKFKKLKIE